MTEQKKETVKVPNGYFELILSEESKKTIRKILDKDLPFRLSHWLNKYFFAAEKAAQEYLKIKHSFISKFAELNDNGTIKADKDQNIIWKPDGLQQFNVAINEIIGEEVDLKLPYLYIDFDELDKRISDTIKPREMALMPFLKDTLEKDIEQMRENDQDG